MVRLQLDRGSPVATYEGSGDEHRTRIASHRGDLRSRPAWWTRVVQQVPRSLAESAIR